MERSTKAATPGRLSGVGCDTTVEPAEATVELVRGAGGEMVSMQPCRLDDPSDCEALVELAVGTCGRIDVLFNLAVSSTPTRRTRPESSA